MSKEQLRRELLRKRNELDIDLRHRESASIRNTLLSMSDYQNAKTVFVYVSYKSEVETNHIIDAMLKDGKRIAVPLCNVKTHTMQTVKLTDMSQLRCGAYGILEPDIKAGVVSPSEIDLAVVPAISFDRNGMRLGYGAGYYDRFLADFKGVSVGLCFSDCIVGSLPAYEFDKPVNKIITGRELINCGK